MLMVKLCSLYKEGTTQGDPMAMPMYALATILLIKKVAADMKQIWYADDTSAGGSVKRVLECWQKVQDEGPHCGYHSNPAKTWLLVPIGTRRYIEEVVSNKVREWVAEIEELTSFAVTQPQAAYAALMHGVMEKWNYFT